MNELTREDVISLMRKAKVNIPYLFEMIDQMRDFAYVAYAEIDRSDAFTYLLNGFEDKLGMQEEIQYHSQLRQQAEDEVRRLKAELREEKKKRKSMPAIEILNEILSQSMLKKELK